MCYECIGARSIEMYSPEKSKKNKVGKNYDIDADEDNAFMQRYGGTKLTQFIDDSDGGESLQKRFDNAVKILGYPESKDGNSWKGYAARIEEDISIAEYPSIEEYMGQVNDIINFINSIDDEGGANYDLLPKPTQPFDDRLPNGGGINVSNRPKP
jgi:hypothetical protein